MNELILTLADTIITIHNPPPEINPEHIFQAANRINYPGDDITSLLDLAGRDLVLAACLTNIRRAIDQHAAPSMSVGDSYELRHDGTTILHATCEPTGWTTRGHAPNELPRTLGR